MWTRTIGRGHFRTHRARGVSPIIATILLVMITVVLAAVVYVMAAGMAQSAAEMPLGVVFVFGTASNVTSSAALPSCAPATECYSLPIASVSHGLKADGLTFGVRGGSGASLPVTNWSFTLVSLSGTSTATWIGGSTCSGTACTAPLIAGEEILVDSHGTSSLYSDTVVAAGEPPFTGDVSSFALPK